MSFNNFDRNPRIFELVSEYEAMSLKGTVAFLEEKDFLCLIDYYEKESLPERALEVVDYALEHYSYSSDFLLKKAHLLLEINLVELALDTLQQAAAFSPSEVQISLLRVEALILLKMYDEAESIIEDLKNQVLNNNYKSRIYVAEAMIYEAKEEHERVFYSLKAALQKDPNNQDALERLWLCVEISKKYEESIILHNEILCINAYSYMAWYNLGHAYNYLGQYENAIEAYEFAFLTNEKFEFAYRDCAETCLAIKNYAKALECYQEALEHFEPDADLFLRIGQCYQHTGKYEIARSFYSRSDKMESNNDEVYFHIGECYANEDNWRGAITFYKKAILIEDKREEYFAALAEAYYQVEGYEQAKPLFKKACEIAPDQTQYWIQFATFLMETNRGEEAVELLIDSEYYTVGAEIVYCRVACLFSIGKRQEALYFLGEALAEDFDMYEALFDLSPNLRYDKDVQALISIYR